MDSLDHMKSTNFYDIWIYLWETYGDPYVSPFRKDLLPLVVATSSPLEITTSTIVSDDAYIHIVMDSHNSVKHDINCLLDLVP